MLESKLFSLSLLSLKRKGKLSLDPGTLAWVLFGLPCSPALLRKQCTAWAGREERAAGSGTAVAESHCSALSD